MIESRQNEKIISKIREKLEAKKLSSTGPLFVGFGLILLLIGRVFISVGGNLSSLGTILLIIGIPVYFIGCFRIAKGKGYHSAWGLLGLLILPGLVFLYWLPNRIKTAEPVEIHPNSNEDQIAESIKKANT